MCLNTWFPESDSIWERYGSFMRGVFLEEAYHHRHILRFYILALLHARAQSLPACVLSVISLVPDYEAGSKLLLLCLSHDKEWCFPSGIVR